MHMNPNHICKLCKTSYEKIIHFEKHMNNGKKFTFFLHKNNYDNIPQEVRTLPKFHTIQHYRGSPHLVYDHKTDKERFNLKMKMKDGNTLDNELIRFHTTLKKKYADICV